jgi:hypothetical protein
MKMCIREVASKCAITVGISVLALACPAATASAFQPDTPFLAHQEKNKAKWAQEDKVINEKLAALEQKFGKKPNIIYILADDVGWGEMGWQGGGKHRGTPTPELDKLAFDGMRFWTAYAEPSCTPSRIAINTGRHPVRTGLLSVLWPGQTEGLSSREVTVAEVLSEAGYNTAMWGKWHLGEEPEHAPENQGYDYAYYGMWNGAPDNWPASFDMYKDAPNPMKAMFYDFPGAEEYKNRTGIDLTEAAFIGRKGEGRKPVEGIAGTLGPTDRKPLRPSRLSRSQRMSKTRRRTTSPSSSIGRPTPNNCRVQRPTITTSMSTRSTLRLLRWRPTTHTCGNCLTC